MKSKLPLPAELQSPIEQAAAVLKNFGADSIYLFGSFVDGTARADSDIDMAVSGLDPRHFFQAMGQMLLILPRPLDLIDLDEDTPFTNHLKQEGQLYRVA